MKFTITNVDTKSIQVTYENGNVIYIPTTTGATKEHYAQLIKSFEPITVVDVPVKDVPYKKGDTGTVGDDITVETTPEEKFDYETARLQCYPSPEVIIDAMYPYATGGDVTKKAALDAHIKLVWDNIAADSTKYTVSEIDAKIAEFKKDSAFIQ